MLKVSSVNKTDTDDRVTTTEQQDENPSNNHEKEEVTNAILTNKCTIT